MEKEITVDVQINTKEAKEKAIELIELLKAANSLADELAGELKELKMNIQL